MRGKIVREKLGRGRVVEGKVVSKIVREQKLDEERRVVGVSHLKKPQKWYK